MRAEWYPESIRLTSDALNHDGFRVVLRELPDAGEEGSAQRGTPYFHFGYRPFQEKGRTIFLFREAPERPVLTNRIASLFPPNKAFLCSCQGAGGRIATFEVHPRFFEEVLRRAGIPARGFGSLPPARFAINRQVDALCQLLMWETEVYLDEFVFRHNRRKQPMAAFQTLLGLGTGRKPTSYARIRGGPDLLTLSK